MGQARGKKKSLTQKARDTYNRVTGKGGKGTGKKRRGVDWYAKAVLKEKLKRKLFRLKYGATGR